MVSVFLCSWYEEDEWNVKRINLSLLSQKQKYYPNNCIIYDLTLYFQPHNQGYAYSGMLNMPKYIWILILVFEIFRYTESIWPIYTGIQTILNLD